MSRVARFVIPGVPHHITQRGNRRGDLFYTNSDRERFIEWLAEASRKWSLSILAYCLMTNHVHLQVVPANTDSLSRTLRSVFTKYAMRLNAIYDWSGYVVQSRFFSSPLDDRHAEFVRRYIEDNPVRAKMVLKPEDYKWSSAYTRHRGLTDPLIDLQNPWYRKLVPEKTAGPHAQLDEEMLQKIRHLNNRNLPIGSQEYIQSLEERTGKILHVRPGGRPPKTN